MVVSNHAIKRYKQRVGMKRAEDKKVRKAILSKIKTSTINKYSMGSAKKQYRIDTTGFTAVCEDNRILTILPRMC